MYQVQRLVHRRSIRNKHRKRQKKLLDNFAHQTNVQKTMENVQNVCTNLDLRILKLLVEIR